MRSCGLLGLALAGLLLLAPTARADDKPGDKTPEPASSFKPAALLRIEAIDDLFADLRYILKQAGQKEVGDQLEMGLKLLTGGKGLAGIDTKKPIGLYASVASKLNESQVMLLLPISDEKKFIEFLNERDIKPEKGNNGVYTLNLDNLPFPILARFANNYLYATAKFNKDVKMPARDKLPKPAAVLAGGSGALSLTANVDRLPNQIRKVAISFVALQLGNLKEEKLENETDAQLALRGAMLDELAAQFKLIVEEGGPIQLKLNVDRKKHDLSMSFNLAGKPNTTLAKNIIALARTKSLGAALMGSDSALGGYLNLTLPASVVKKLGPVVDESIKKGLDNADKEARELLKPVATALEATAKSGRLDLAFDMRGPFKSGKYTVVASGEVKNGDKIEAALRKAIAKLPEEKRKPIKLDEAKVGSVNIHRIEQKNIDAKTKAILGDGPMYVAIRKDAVLFSMGEDALTVLKTAVKAESKTGNLVRMEASLARMAKLIGQTQAGAEAAAKEAFKEKGSDKVTLLIKAGASFEAKMNVKSAVLTFAGLMDKAQKDKQKDQ